MRELLEFLARGLGEEPAAVGRRGIGNRRWRPLREVVLGDDTGRGRDGPPPFRFGRGHRAE